MEAPRALLSEALRSGKADADAKVAAALYHRALGFKHKTEKVFQFQGSIVRADVVERFAPDTTACIYWLKTDQPDMWREDRPQSPVRLKANRAARAWRSMCMSTPTRWRWLG